MNVYENKRCLAERVGFEALIAGPCMALHSLVQDEETRDLGEFQFPLDIIEVF